MASTAPAINANEPFCAWLDDRGLEVITCRDPGSTPLGERVRDLLLHSDDQMLIGRRAEMLLYMAARAQMVDEIIRPALEAGKTVVSDRYLLANLVYQGHAGGLDLEMIRAVGGIATGEYHRTRHLYWIYRWRPPIVASVARSIGWNDRVRTFASDCAMAFSPKPVGAEVHSHRRC